jgi:aminopeptidase
MAGSMDKRWKQLAALLVDYSLEVKRGQKVIIAMSEIEPYPLVLACYESCIKAGAYPQVQFLSEELNRSVLSYGSQEQIDWVPEIERYGMEWADAYLGLRGAHNLDVFWDIPDKRLADFRRALGKVSSLRWLKTRWCLLRVPGNALAFQAGVDEETLTDMFFEACLLDWRELSQEWHRLSGILGKGNVVRLVGNATDLTFSVAGRRWSVADGKVNMPDGEIATSPVETTADGEIYFELPGVIGGRLVEDLHLRWKKGTLTEARSSTNQDFLESLLKTDEGASRIGEFAFGTNPAVTHFCKDILLDEKIGGTVHIALGRAYPDTGGTNQSAIHWDIIKDVRREGRVYVDGGLVFENGRFVI